MWPAPKAAHAVRGFAVAPLYAGAVNLRDTSPETYQLVTLVDALRVGRARERSLAKEHLDRAFAKHVAA